MAADAGLPELASVPWRRRVDARALDRRDATWTATTVAHSLPFLLAAGVLVWLAPVTAPVALLAAVHAWGIPALYARRGADVVRRRPRPRVGRRAERRSAGLLGDLVGHEARELHAQTGLVVERGGLGVWVVGEGGALLVRRGRSGRPRVECLCVGVRDADLPGGDRIAHLLLALRADESGFATVANLAFSGAPWRVRARLAEPARLALDRALAMAGSSPTRPAQVRHSGQRPA